MTYQCHSKMRAFSTWSDQQGADGEVGANTKLQQSVVDENDRSSATTAAPNPVSMRCDARTVLFAGLQRAERKESKLDFSEYS